MKRKTSVHKKPTISLRLLYIVLALAVVLVIAVLTKSYMSKINQPEVSVTQNQQVRELISFVDSAAILVSEKGQEAFNELKQNETWFINDKHVFVYDINGNAIVLPSQPELEGTNRLDAVDQNGVYFVKEMINQAYSKNSGWVNYLYLKPGEANPFEKLEYFKKVLVNGKYYLVGSGIYLE